MLNLNKKLNQSCSFIGRKSEVGEFVDSRRRIEKRQGQREKLLLA